MYRRFLVDIESSLAEKHTKCTKYYVAAGKIYLLLTLQQATGIASPEIRLT